jgi:biopolymer transport protein ExbB
MWPLLFFSIITLAVILERMIVFLGFRFDIRRMGILLEEAIRNKNITLAVEICETNKKNIASEIFSKNLFLLSKNKEDFEKAIESASNVKVFILEKNLNILSSMANIAPLTGFLGTVSGMISAFKIIALSDNVSASLVAGGIYEALITTEAGLVVAILAVLANNFFVHKVNSVVNQIEETTSNLIKKEIEGKA